MKISHHLVVIIPRKLHLENYQEPEYKINIKISQNFSGRGEAPPVITD